MDQRKYDTGPLWTNFTSLLNMVVAFLFLFFGYLFLEEQIQGLISWPSYTEEQLEEIGKKGEVRRIQERNDNWDLVENGIHVKTGLKADPNLKLVIGACTSCHSSKLITQNRATRQGWKNMILWMQETQGLNDLGSREPRILDYLAKHYSPKEEGRRKNLDIEAIEWYILNLE